MTDDTSKIKNVLVVGLGYAGANAVQGLAGKLPLTHRIVAVHESSFGYNPISCLRAATVPGWEKQVTAPLDGLFPAATRHLLLANHRAVKLNPHSVILEPAMEIEFEYAIIATGSTYDFPCRPPRALSNAKKLQAALRSLQSSLKSAKSVLVIGGGPAGVETAGEIASEYPQTRVTILHSRARLFDIYAPKFSASIASQLEAKGVQIYYDCRLPLGDLRTGPVPEQEFSLPDGTLVTADFVFVTFGCKPNSKLIRTLDPSLINPGGFVLVKPTMQLDSVPLDHIFAPGDVNSMLENKLAGAAVRHSWAATANILSMIRGNTSGLKTYSPNSGPFASISVGPDGGAAQILGFVFGPWLVSRLFSRSLGRRNFEWSFNMKVE